MAIYNIVTVGDEILKVNAKEVTKFDDRIEKLIRSMIETLYEEDGVGLAAPQIGISKRVIIAYNEEDDKIYELINPVIIESEGIVSGQEGCLSVPGRIGTVKRFVKIVVEGQNAKGDKIKIEAKDMFARVLQHEIDHLNGILFIDKAENIEEIQ